MTRREITMRPKTSTRFARKFCSSIRRRISGIPRNWESRKQEIKKSKERQICPAAVSRIVRTLHVFSGRRLAEIFRGISSRRGKVKRRRPSWPSQALHFCHVQILRIRLCSSCATIAEAEDKIGRIMASGTICGRLSSQSSNFILALAQGKRIPAALCVAFPHFHSDGYYDGLYPYYKTGYSSSSQQ